MARSSSLRKGVGRESLDLYYLHFPYSLRSVTAWMKPMTKAVNCPSLDRQHNHPEEDQAVEAEGHQALNGDSRSGSAAIGSEAHRIPPREPADETEAGHREAHKDVENAPEEEGKSSQGDLGWRSQRAKTRRSC